MDNDTEVNEEEGCMPGNVDDEEDALDAFMSSINAEIEKQASNTDRPINSRGVRDDIEALDDQETYFKYVDETVVVDPEDDDHIEYDSDGNIINTYFKREIMPLPPVDHSQISYEPFERNFYTPHSDIKRLSPTEVDKLRKDLGIKVSGLSPVAPGISFAHFGFDQNLMETIRLHQYHTPTPIQAQGITVALSGRDIVGIAKTGSGKTAAYLLPMMIHTIDQPELKEGDGPIALVCAPTRELVQQIYIEARKFAKAYNLQVVAVFGGVNKHTQALALQAGAEIVIATPGRLIDLIKDNATNLARVTMLVFDEADRMFELGFEPQVRSIANNVRPNRQCMLFSATFKKKIERLCRDILTDPVRIVVGELGEANEDVCQKVIVFLKPADKWGWLTKSIVKFSSRGSVLIFVTKKDNCVELAKNLKEAGHNIGVIHGDFDQYERDVVMTKFRKAIISILVATDVAARGLDIPSIKTVINYDVARDITTHTHRIGRTGRAGETGEAYTLVTPEDLNFLPDLVRNLEGANQEVPDLLLELAMKNPWFKKQREKHGIRGKTNTTFKPRPGLGFKDNADTNAPSTPRTTMDTALQQVTALKKTGDEKVEMLRHAFARDYSRFKRSETSSLPGSHKPTIMNTTPSLKRPNAVDDCQSSGGKKRRTRWDN